MSVILNNTILNDIYKSKDLTIFKCSKSGNFKNYFISPNISIKLYNAKVTWVNDNNVSLSFRKYGKIENNEIIDNGNYMVFLRNLNEKLLDIYKRYKEYYGHTDCETKPQLFYEKDNCDFFYIKCTIPKVKYNNSKPVLNTEYNSVTLDIRNIWENNLGKVGFKLELKNIEY
jgi:hypothetical protein